ncbi:dienelactone hydrolase family protein [Chryseolinea lacunae]|uniref:Dienelactone hydrolase family protein n=1 Tax=Chryseolinea lacunae TaxID=2801331 RepID=A0ABS1KLC4_9BACT|nr:dienelactone hydrolase family protein [Chryseolinea lacunae]MBL0740038.1 dienelactone hydrolase family protein [Chryseolinea lacunae]
MRNLVMTMLTCGVILLGCSKDPVDNLLSEEPTKPVTETPSDTASAERAATTAAVHKAMPLGSDAAPFGYYVYTPAGYTKTGPTFPVIIFLHGSGEQGNSKTNPADLDKVLTHGPPSMIKKKTWAPSHKMIVVSPQCHEGWWDRDHVRAFIKYISVTYRVDPKRIYLTGLSMGGFGTFDQLNSYDDNQIAAAVAIAGSGVMNATFTKRISKVPLWVFHGQDDRTVLPDFSKQIVPAVNALNPTVKAKLTLFPGVGHNSWTMTYSGSGMGKENPSYDPFKQDIYTWMYQFTKP